MYKQNAVNQIHKTSIMQTQQQTGTTNKITEELTNGWLEIINECRQLETKYDESYREGYLDDFRKIQIKMTRNYINIMEKFQESDTCIRSNEEIAKRWMCENLEESLHFLRYFCIKSNEEIAKRWMRKNLEESQQFIDSVVGIKGITEDPIKVAAELEICDNEVRYDSNVIAANTEGTLQIQVIEDNDSK